MITFQVVCTDGMCSVLHDPPLRIMDEDEKQPDKSPTPERDLVIIIGSTIGKKLQDMGYLVLVNAKDIPGGIIVSSITGEQ